MVECQGINYDLMSQEEKVSVEEGFSQFLNTLKEPVQLYIQTRKINLESSLNSYKEKVDEIEREYTKQKLRYEEIANNPNASDEQIKREYYEYIKLNIDASKNYIVFIISPNQKHIDIINYPNILSNDEKNEIINNWIIPELKNISSNNIEEKINLAYKTGVERLVEILNKKYNINLNSDYYESLNKSLQKK